MSVDCAARYRSTGSDEVNTAIVKDLSGGGMLIWTDKPVEEGSKLSIMVMPGKDITPPLMAELVVIRCAVLEMDTDSSYSVACTISHMYEEDEVGSDFP